MLFTLVMLMVALVFLAGKKSNKQKETIRQEESASTAGQMSSQKIYNLPKAVMTHKTLKQLQLFIVGISVSLVLFLGFMTWQTFGGMARMNTFRATGQTTQGIVIGTEYYPGQGRRDSMSYVSYRYMVNNQEYTRRDYVNSNTHSAAREGETITVIYQAGNPAEAVLELETQLAWYEKPDTGRDLLLTIFICAALGIITAIAYSYSRLPARYYKETLITVTGKIVALPITTRKGEEEHWLVYQFEDQVVRQQITSQIHAKLTEGADVRVRYLQDNTAVSRAG